MSQQRWRRLPLDGGHLAVIAGLAVIVILALGFGELYQLRAEALGEYNQAQGQVMQLQAQHDQLQGELEAAQRGDNIEPRARQYFKWMRPGEKRIVVQPAAGPTSVAPLVLPQTAPPYWQQWWERLLGQ